MKKIIAIVIMLMVVVTGCAGLVLTTITMPNGDIVTVESKSDALVTMKRDGVDATVDNRGRPSWMEGLIQYILAKPDVKLSNKDGE